MSSEKCDEILGRYGSTASTSTASIRRYEKYNELIGRYSSSASTSTSRTSYSTYSNSVYSESNRGISLKSKFNPDYSRYSVDSDSVYLAAYNTTDPLTPVSRSQSPLPFQTQPQSEPRRTPKYISLPFQPQQPLPPEPEPPKATPKYFLNSYSPHPRYRRDSMDLRARCTAPQQPMVFTEKPAPEVYRKTYDIRSESKLSAKNIEIHQNGRAILWVKTKIPFWGAPIITIEGPPQNWAGSEGQGRILAATKLKSVRSGFSITLGDPASQENWSQVTYSSWNEKEYFFEVAGRRYSWRSPVTGLMSYLKDTGDYQLVDLDDEKVLAAYVKDREWFAFKPIARIEFYVELGQELEMLALAAILGVEERRRRKNSAAATSGAV